MSTATDRVLFVHAHPDDETIATGGTIATLVAAGAAVTVLTCTRGERGEVIPAGLAALEGDGAALAAHREGELAEAMAALGVDDQRYLGSPGARRPGAAPRRYADSGMVWGADGRPTPLAEVAGDSFCSAPLDEVVADIEAVIAGTGADAVVGYDEDGGYGHPDHVRAHVAARRAAASAGVPFYAIVEPAAPRRPDDIVVDVTPVRGRVVAALLAHATQITVAQESGGAAGFALSSGPLRPIAATEAFRLLPADPSAGGRPAGHRAARPDRGALVASAVLAAAVGLLVGGLLTIGHQQVATLAGAVIPVGVIAALLVVASLVTGLRIVFGSRMVAACAAAGVAVVAGVFSQSGPGGSVLVPANLAGYAWVYGSVLIAVLVLAWPRLPAARDGRMKAGNEVKGTTT